MSEATFAEMPFAPVLPPNATVIMMGTLPPPPDKWAMSFFYPNFQNDMWRIYGLVFFGDAGHFLDESGKRFDADAIRAFLFERGIALCSTVQKALRLQGNAADDQLQVIEPVDLASVFAQLPQLQHILASGGLATDTLLSLLDNPQKAPKAGESVPYEYAGRCVQLWRLPSSSRAYRLAVVKKAAVYQSVMQACGIL